MPHALVETSLSVVVGAFTIFVVLLVVQLGVPSLQYVFSPYERHIEGTLAQDLKGNLLGGEGLRQSGTKMSSIAHISQLPALREDLHLFVAITTGPKNFDLRAEARRTWLSDCNLDISAYQHNSTNTSSSSFASSPCVYRFFIDKSTLVTEANNGSSDGNSSSALDALLFKEQDRYGDLVFRDACSLMRERHRHQGVHYGNIAHPNYTEDANEPSSRNPDYQLRRMYKIDWKVCFL